MTSLSGITTTTIKLPSDTRDRLKALAAERRETIGSTVEYLLEERLRLHRFEQLAADIAATPADEMQAWRIDADMWWSTELIDD